MEVMSHSSRKTYMYSQCFAGKEEKQKSWLIHDVEKPCVLGAVASDKSERQREGQFGEQSFCTNFNFTLMHRHWTLEIQWQ